jgi:hypothetical protein
MLFMLARVARKSRRMASMPQGCVQVAVVAHPLCVTKIAVQFSTLEEFQGQ